MSFKPDTVAVYPTLQPLDWGASFALSRKRLLLGFAVMPALIECGIAFLHYHKPLPPQDLFLVFVLSSLVSCWLLTVTVMMCIEDARAMVIRPFALAKDALRNLPKVFISYVALLAAIFSAVIIFPLLLLVLFFIWAPFFCIGELFVKKPQRNGYAREPEETEDYYEEDEAVPRNVMYFTRKSLVELGFARSLQLGSKNAGATLQVALLIWFANVVPLALVDLITSDVNAFWPEMLKILSASLAEVLAVAVAAGAFLSMIPAEAREELGLASPIRVLPISRNRSLGKISVSVILLVVSALATGLVLRQTQRAHRMPETAVVELQSTELRNKAFVVTLRLIDTDHHFRWLDANGFHLVLPKAASAPSVNAMQPQNGQEDAPQEQKEIEPVSIPVLRATLYDDEGKEVLPQTIAPYFEPLKLILEFEVPEVQAARGSFTIEYVSYFGDKRQVYQGSYGG